MTVRTKGESETGEEDSRISPHTSAYGDTR